MSGKPKTVFRRPTQNNYFSSKRDWMQDSRLSLRATGLIAKMLSMPPEWEFHQSHLVTIIPEGKDALRSAFKEAAKYGYLIKHPQIKNEKGQYHDQVYEIYDSPQFETPIPDELVENLFSNKPDWNKLKKHLTGIYEPIADFPQSVNPPLESTLLSEEYLNKHHQKGKKIGGGGYRQESESIKKKPEPKQDSKDDPQKRRDNTEKENNHSREIPPTKSTVPPRKSKDIEITSYETACEWMSSMGYAKKDIKSLCTKENWIKVCDAREEMNQENNIKKPLAWLRNKLRNLNENGEL